MQLNHLSFGDYAVPTFYDDLVYMCSQVSLGDRSQRAKTALCTMGASVFRLTICIMTFGKIMDCNICSFTPPPTLPHLYALFFAISPVSGSLTPPTC